MSQNCQNCKCDKKRNMDDCNCDDTLDQIKKLTYGPRERRNRPLSFRQSAIKKIITSFSCGCCENQVEEPEPVPEQPVQQTQPEPIPEPKPLKKRAVLVGINYIGTSGELGGCINDVNNIRKMLIDNYEYKAENILTMTDHTSKKPSYSNIVNELKNLVASDADQMYFHYSGHGSYMSDNNNEEIDGKDECLVPIDYNRSGFIRDDIIKSIVKNLNVEKKLTMVIDACHSATMVDLKHRVDCKSVQLEQNNVDESYLYSKWSYDFEISENHKYNDQCNVFTLSGCRDSQTSADAWINQKYQGALSYHFMKCLELNKYDLKTKYLLKDIHCMLKLLPLSD